MIGSIILSAGIMQSIFLAFYFYHQDRKGKQFGGGLSFFFSFLTILMMNNLVFYSGKLQEFPHLIKTGYLFGFLSAPFFSYAVTKYFGIPREKGIWVSLSFLPSIIFLVYYLPFFLLSGENKLISLEKFASNELQSEANLLQIATLTISLFIFVRVYFRFQMILEEFSKIPNAEAKIFNRYVLILILWLILCILFCFLFPGRNSESISNIGFSVWVLGFAWHKIYQEQLESHSHIISADTKPETFKYQKSYLPEEKLNQLGEKLDVILNQEETILDGDLSLSKISKILEQSPHVTSQVFHRYYGQSLIEIIRTKRIEIAKRALIKSDLPVLRIGFDVGFNSKNAFIRAFKDLTNLTPSDYRKKFSTEPKERNP